MAPTLALAPVLGDGEVDLGKCGIRKENLGYFLSRVKKWGREAVSLALPEMTCTRVRHCCDR